MTGIRTPARLSYSALASYAECGERFKLERGYGLKGGTWWSTVAGSAIHEVTEAFDRGDFSLPSKQIDPEEFAPGGMYEGVTGDELDRDAVRGVFIAALDKYAAQAMERDGEIRASGKVQRTIGKGGGPNKKDRAWWEVMGPDYILRYIEWRYLTKWSIAVMPDGNLGIEVALPIDLGGEPQLGFIDRVFITPEGKIVIVDIKTGNLPASTLQLGVYRVALLKLHGIEADYGTYWLASEGDIMELHDLTNYSEEYVEELFAAAWRGIRNRVFLPNVSPLCNGCGVRDYCRAKKGRLAGSLPVVDEMLPPKPKPSPRDVTEVTAP